MARGESVERTAALHRQRCSERRREGPEMPITPGLDSRDAFEAATSAQEQRLAAEVAGPPRGRERGGGGRVELS